MAEVKIYTTPTCGYCVITKKFLNDHNVKYTEFDVSADTAKGNEMVEKSGQMGVPVLDIDGEIIVGFDQRRISEKLGIK
ncbi:MAG: glutaredoxin domain-containing protein [bacterium]|nr:glutaredoxin domain-containing protein [bacterium]